MPGLYKDEGIVLRTIKLGEADRILTLYTVHGGKIRAVAKGVRKTKSRFGGRLEPFSRLDLMLYSGRNLDTITAAQLLDSHKEARSDLTRLSAAAALRAGGQDHARQRELENSLRPSGRRARCSFTCGVRHGRPGLRHQAVVDLGLPV